MMSPYSSACHFSVWAALPKRYHTTLSRPLPNPSPSLPPSLPTVQPYGVFSTEEKLLSVTDAAFAWPGEEPLFEHVEFNVQVPI